jgi:Icc-related predicted phosphoesterase
LNNCFFVSDLHGHLDRYRKLFAAIVSELPAAVFIGGDILPSGLMMSMAAERGQVDYINDFLIPKFSMLKEQLGDAYPRVFIILGNDDGRFEEVSMLNGTTYGIWQYIHNRREKYGNHTIYGYANIPPSPFLLKDWERYDVSRYVDPGCVPPNEGHRTVPITEHEAQYSTIKGDLDQLTGAADLSNAIFLFHTPPHDTNLDRAALDGKTIDHVPLDVHIGSIAVRRFIESRQPLLTLHGHVHESASLTGSWHERIGNTYSFSAAHNGSELALIRFDLNNLNDANRELI